MPSNDEMPPKHLDPKSPDTDPIIEKINNEFKIPQKIPTEWIHHHGFDEKEFRQSENAALSIMQAEHDKEMRTVALNTSDAIKPHFYFVQLYIGAFVAYAVMKLL